jgi:hypothetical protein
MPALSANTRAAASAACLGSQSMARTRSLVTWLLDIALTRVSALHLQGAEPLGVGLLAECGAGALEGGQHAGGIELGALVVGVDGLGLLDALVGGEGLALQLG